MSMKSHVLKKLISHLADIPELSKKAMSEGADMPAHDEMEDGMPGKKGELAIMIAEKKPKSEMAHEGSPMEGEPDPDGDGDGDVKEMAKKMMMSRKSSLY